MDGTIFKIFVWKKKLKPFPITVLDENILISSCLQIIPLSDENQRPQFLKNVHRARSMALSCGYRIKSDKCYFIFFLLHALKGERSLFASNCRHIVDFLDTYCTDTCGIIGNGIFLLQQYLCFFLDKRQN